MRIKVTRYPGAQPETLSVEQWIARETAHYEGGQIETLQREVNHLTKVVASLITCMSAGPRYEFQRQHMVELIECPV